MKPDIVRRYSHNPILTKAQIPYPVETVHNAAVVKLKNQKSDMLCKPYYVGALPFHIPNNTNIIVDYKNGAVVVKKGCTDFQAVDKAIAQTRAFEKKFKLNTGK